MVTRLTPFQQGELAAFTALLEALEERRDSGAEMTSDQILEFLRVAVGVLEGFDDEGPVFEVVK